MYYYVGWDGERSSYEAPRRFAGKRKQGIRIAEREVEIVADKKEEVRLPGTELKASEKVVSAGFPPDAAASVEDAGQNDGIVPILSRTTCGENGSSTGTGRTWLLVLTLMWRLLSGSGGARSVCASMLRRKCAFLILDGKREREREQLMRKATYYHQSGNCFIVVASDGNEIMEFIPSNT